MSQAERSTNSHPCTVEGTTEMHIFCRVTIQDVKRTEHGYGYGGPQVSLK